MKAEYYSRIGQAWDKLKLQGDYAVVTIGGIYGLEVSVRDGGIDGESILNVTISADVSEEIVKRLVELLEARAGLG